jgi:hypothetical protein
MPARRRLTEGRPPWGGARAKRLKLAVLARDYDDRLGYTPCHHCGKPATSADHYPVARIDGAPDTLDALVAACLPCNVSRGVAMWQERGRPPPPSRVW